MGDAKVSLDPMTAKTLSLRVLKKRIAVQGPKEGRRGLRINSSARPLRDALSPPRRLPHRPPRCESATTASCGRRVGRGHLVLHRWCDPNESQSCQSALRERYDARDSPPEPARDNNNPAKMVAVARMMRVGSTRTNHVLGMLMEHNGTSY